MRLYKVQGSNCGRQLVEEVKASTQSEARRKFERINPSYKAGSAKDIGAA